MIKLSLHRFLRKLREGIVKPFLHSGLNTPKRWVRQMPFMESIGIPFCVRASITCCMSTPASIKKPPASVPIYEQLPLLPLPKLINFNVLTWFKSTIGVSSSDISPIILFARISRPPDIIEGLSGVSSPKREYCRGLYLDFFVMISGIVGILQVSFLILFLNEPSHK